MVYFSPMNEKTIDGLFGSAARMKIVRLFVFNPDKIFDIESIAARSGATKALVKKEIKNLLKLKLVIRKARGFVLNRAFAYLSPFQEFLSATNPTGADIADRMKKAGKVRFLALSGVFIRNPESRLDILIVGDRIKKAPLDKVLKSLESAIGKELAFSVFDTEDFKYRISMRDKLVLDVLDFPHEKIVNKLGL
jgi:hypothetical protein